MMQHQERSAPRETITIAEMRFLVTTVIGFHAKEIAEVVCAIDSVRTAVKDILNTEEQFDEQMSRRIQRRQLLSGPSVPKRSRILSSSPRDGAAVPGTTTSVSNRTTLAVEDGGTRQSYAAKILNKEGFRVMHESPHNHSDIQRPRSVTDGAKNNTGAYVNFKLPRPAPYTSGATLTSTSYLNPYSSGQGCSAIQPLNKALQVAPTATSQTTSRQNRELSSSPRESIIGKRTSPHRKEGPVFPTNPIKKIGDASQLASNIQEPINSLESVAPTAEQQSFPDSSSSRFGDHGQAQFPGCSPSSPSNRFLNKSVTAGAQELEVECSVRSSGQSEPHYDSGGAKMDQTPVASCPVGSGSSQISEEQLESSIKVERDAAAEDSQEQTFSRGTGSDSLAICDPDDDQGNEEGRKTALPGVNASQGAHPDIEWEQLLDPQNILAGFQASIAAGYNIPEAPVARERRYKCPACPKKFQHQPTLSRHMRQHSWTCQNCDQSFTLFKDLKTHQNRNRGCGAARTNRTRSPMPGGRDMYVGDSSGSTQSAYELFYHGCTQHAEAAYAGDKTDHHHHGG